MEIYFEIHLEIQFCHAPFRMTANCWIFGDNGELLEHCQGRQSWPTKVTLVMLLTLAVKLASLAFTVNSFENPLNEIPYNRIVECNQL